MPRAVVLLAPGFEEIEAVTVIDVLRRAGVEVTSAGLEASPVAGNHQIGVAPDCPVEQVQSDDFDAIVLPGGMPGATTLRDDPRSQRLIRAFARASKLMGAICAGPIALEAAGVLEGRRATSFPGHELPSAIYLEQRVVQDGNVITSRGPGTALEFALQLVEVLVGPQRSSQLRDRMLVC